MKTVAGKARYHLIKRALGGPTVVAKTYCGLMLVGKPVVRKADCKHCLVAAKNRNS